MRAKRNYPEICSTILLCFMGLLLAGCGKIMSSSDDDAWIVSTALLDLPLKECREVVQFGDENVEIKEKAPFCTLEQGDAEFICFDGTRSKIKNITPILFNLSNECAGGFQINSSIYYNGVIDLSFLQLIEVFEGKLSDMEAIGSRS